MSFTPIAKGTPNWDVPLNLALTELDNEIADGSASSLQAANNLDDLTNVPQARANLQIGNSSVVDASQINVKDHGAIGNGTADDTAAINTAIDIVGANGGTVFFPPGNYLISAPLTVSIAATVLRGSGAESTRLVIAPGFTGTSVVTITAANCQVISLSIAGTSSTTTSNPITDGIDITGVRRTRVNYVNFTNINGYAIKVSSTNANSNSNPLGTQISSVYMNACAGGVYFLGNTTQSYAMNSQITDIQSYQGGVTSGASANFDCIRVEDAWDVLIENAITWQSFGTGSSLHILGNSAATFVNNLDALGPTTGVCVKIEDGTNGSPQNTQISGGVIQQGNIGVQISGAAKQIHLNTSRIINNQTHGVQISGTATTIYLSELFFSTSGAAATGTNYDINWSGTALGFITNCRFASPIVTVGTAGVQNTINVASAGQNVRVINASFQGVGQTSSNWFTNTPSAVLEMSSGDINFVTRPLLRASISSRPTTSGSSAFEVNVGGSDAFDRYRLNGDGSITVGSGAAARDVTYGRTAANTFGLTTTDLAIVTAGRGIKIAEGTNAKMGITAAMTAGTITVSTTAVTANSRIFLTAQNSGTLAGALRVSAITPGTSFVITSSSATDTSTVAWFIVDHT